MIPDVELARCLQLEDSHGSELICGCPDTVLRLSAVRDTVRPISHAISLAEKHASSSCYQDGPAELFLSRHTREGGVRVLKSTGQLGTPCRVAGARAST
jgi:hypothetical protein